MVHSLLEKRKELSSGLQRPYFSHCLLPALGEYTYVTASPSPPPDLSAPPSGSPNAPLPCHRTEMLTSSSSPMPMDRHWVQGSVCSGVHYFLFNLLPPPVSVCITSILDSGQGLLLGLLGLMFPLSSKFHINGDLSRAPARWAQNPPVVSHSLWWDTIPASLEHGFVKHTKCLVQIRSRMRA